jgi:hypothetical protein
MPQPPLSPQERRLATFCRLSAVLYLLGAIGFVVAPFVMGADPGPFSFWSVVAAALMTSIATSCLVTAGQPRERRHAMLPVVIAALTVSVLGVVLHLGGMFGQMGLVAVSAPLLLLTLFIYRSAAPGVHSAPAQEGPPAAPEEPADRKIQLGIKSS